MKPMAKHYSHKGQKIDSRWDLVNFYRKNKNINKDNVECVFDPFEHVKFIREKNVNYDEAVFQRLVELRSRDKKFNFWYSGGMDSHIILHYMKKFNIWPDEIFNHDTFPEFEDVIQHQESAAARKVLKNYGIPKSVKITYLDMDHAYYKSMIENDDFWNSELDSASTGIFQLTMMSTCNMHKHKPWKIDYEGETHLMGAIYPKLRYNTGIWYFNMTSGTIDGAKWSEHIENFLISCPDFTNVYFNAVIDFFESKGYSEQELNYISNMQQREYKYLLDVGCHREAFEEIDEIMKRGKFLRSDIDVGNEAHNRSINYHRLGNSPKDADLFTKLTKRKIEWWPRFLDKTLLYEEEFEISSSFAAQTRTKDYIIKCR